MQKMAAGGAHLPVFFRTVGVRPDSIPAVYESMPGAIEQSEIEQLVERARQGDRDAFGRLALLHRARVRGLLHRLAGADRLDDLEQDVFIAAWLNLKKFRGDAAFATWLLRIAVNKARRALKRDRPLPALDIEPRSEAPGPLAHLLLDETRIQLRAAVASLPTRLRTVFQLRFVEGLRGPEIAQVLGVREATVRSRLTAARQTLRARLRR